MNTARIHRRKRFAQDLAFTLIELLVSSAVIAVLLGMIVFITNNLGGTIGRASSRLDAFASARSAFDLVTRRISQATLNPTYVYLDAQGRAESHPDYQNGSAGQFIPARYGRTSDLQFLVQPNVQNHGYGQEVYFVSPLASAAGTATPTATGLLNAGSCFVRYGSNQDYLPATIKMARSRYRLMLANQPGNRLTVYASVALGDLLWLTEIQNSATKPGRYVAPVAENVLVLTVWPRLAETDDARGDHLTASYAYDSHPAPKTGDDTPRVQPETTDQLPPTVQLTMVVLTEASAARFAGDGTHPPAALETALLNEDGNPKFAVSTTEQQQADLNDLSTRLARLDANFEVFTTVVPMREARWGVHPTQ